MFRASSLLKNTRLDKEWELKDIAKSLKTPQKYLEAIENEDTAQFPQEPYCSLIVKDYADHLGLNGREILSLFRRDFAQKRKIKTASRHSFSITPQFTFTILIIFFTLIFSSYLVTEYLKSNRPPELKVNWPQTPVVLGDAVDVSGVTDPEATVSINQDLVIVDPNGNFDKKITLTGKSNKITIESKSPNGKVTKTEKVIEADNP